MHNSNPTKKSSFSRNHPFLFGFALILAATVLLGGTVAAVRHFSGPGRADADLGDEGLGVVRVEGVIAGSEAIIDWIETLYDDDDVKGVLMRVNCPGGAVAPSQEIYAAVARLARKKPVVVSMASVAASGGYYVSAPAQLIVANPSTLTGSIGVIMELSNLQGLFDKLGIKRQALTSGPLKDAGSPFKTMTPEDKKYLLGLIGDIHEQFVADVAAARVMDPEALRPLADGRALTGNQALAAGLVDKLGGMDVAVRELKKLCGMDPDTRVPVVSGPKKDEPWLQQILGQLTINLHTDLPTSGVTIR